MRFFMHTAACTALLLTATLSAADNPFVGKWKADPSKSNLTGETITYSNAGSKGMRFSNAAGTYTFTTDGKEHPGLFGRTVSVKQEDPNTWEMTSTLNGQMLSHTTMQVSSDGKTLTETSKGTRPDGTSFETTETYEREGSGSGVVGKWKSTQVKQSAPMTIEFGDNGANGLNFMLPQLKADCRVKFDGHDYPATGPTVPPGLTLAVTKEGDRTMHMTEKVKGKPLFKATYTVSDDGKTLTEVGYPVSKPGEQTKMVYDRE